MVMMATAIQRKVMIQRVKYKISPNIYVMMVAASGKIRKSVAMDIGLDILKAAVPDVRVIGDRLTPEGLVKHVNRPIEFNNNGHKETRQDSTILIHGDELANLFGYDRGI